MSLLKLPNESIIQIIRTIQDLPTLLSLTMTCRSLKIFAEPFLYSSLVLWNGTKVGLLEEALITDTKRRNHVRDLELRYSLRKFDNEIAPTLDLCSLPNLTQFISESPFCNFFSWRAREPSWIKEMQAYLKCFERASLLNTPVGSRKPLRRLRSITLHWTSTAGERYWEATASCPIFLLPELEALEISCVKIGQRSSVDDDAGISARLHPFTRQTNLKSLTITEGTVTATSLKLILSLPKALQSLSYCETIHHLSEHSDVFATDDMVTFNAALAQQSESLEDLNIMKAAHRVRICSLKLPDFKALTSLRLGPFTEQTFISWTLSHPIPPSLEVLQLMHTSHHRPDDLFLAIQIDGLLQSAAVRGVPFTLDLVGPRVSKRIYENFLDRFKKRLKAQFSPSDDGPSQFDPPLRLQFTNFLRRNFIPPYLYGETKPLWIVYNLSKCDRS